MALTSLLLLGLSYIVPLLLIGVESMSVKCGISFLIIVMTYLKKFLMMLKTYLRKFLIINEDIPEIVSDDAKDILEEFMMMVMTYLKKIP